MTTTKRVREGVWQKLREVAYPDSRFHYNFAEYIPDFIGSQFALDRFTALPIYQNAGYLFIAPDNCLTGLRERALRDGKTIVVSTYGISRGFVLLSPHQIPSAEIRFASWLDGMEAYGRIITLAEVAQRGRLDALITGASAVSLEGIRFGKGHGFFDLEWGMFSAVQIVDEATPIAAFVHDVQVVDESLTPGATDVIVDYVLTPTRTIAIDRQHKRPPGIQWNLLDAEIIDAIPPLQELQQQQQSLAIGNTR